LPRFMGEKPVMVLEPVFQFFPSCLPSVVQAVREGETFGKTFNSFPVASWAWVCAARRAWP